MGYEIERKFLVKGEYKSHSFKRFTIRQGYLSLSGTSAVRIRIKGEKAFVTIKSAVEEGHIGRKEWEYAIPVTDAEEMLLLCDDGIVEKTRYLVRSGNCIFEVDDFEGANKGLEIAELELESEDAEFERPGWLGEEVTGNVRYYNSYLSIHPYSEWDK